MGEVVVSCEEQGIHMVVEEKDAREKEEKVGTKEGSSSMVRWERFLPKMGLRVLLVEADDSTRQIIGALLRKCGYKVASVPDGLKAWEVLKARQYNIDLILTEVELPSISGFALLTLIMEHEICKNIPVIMMSAYDSVSMVYKCMLRGAADFLVKPIRINELKNLWQHVWRRQFWNREGLGPQDESVGQQKLEATAENNAASDHSSGSKACGRRQEECIKKGSDAQSSCRKPDLEAESAYTAEVEDYLQSKQRKSPVSHSKVQDHSNCNNSGQNLCPPESAVAGSDTAAFNDEDMLDRDGMVEHQSHGEKVNLYTEASVNGDVFANSFAEAIDLIGAFDNHSRYIACSNGEANIFEPSLQLDLSLRRFHSGVVENKATYEKQMLNHSNASAFTRYVNKTLPTSNSNATSGSASKEDRLNYGDHLSGNAPDGNDRKVISFPTNLTREVEKEYQNGSQRLFPIPVPVRGIQVDVCASPAGYASTHPPTKVCTPSPSPCPSSTDQLMNSFHQTTVDVINGRQHYCSLDQSPGTSSNQPISKQDQTFESLERAHFSLVADQSASSVAGGSNGNVQQGDVMAGGFEGGNDQIHVTHESNRQWSLQREAALNKFRLKRKERCYDKKVRYESRKKLAEQRPRVKGQFVRQVPPDPPPPRTDNSGGNAAVN